MSFGLLLIPIVFCIAFVLSYRINRTSLWSSIFFLLMIGSAMLILLGFSIVYSEHMALRLAAVILWAPFVLLMVFGVLGLIVFLILNSIVVIKREGFSFTHSVGLIVAIVMILYFVLVAFSPSMSNATATWPDLLRLLYEGLGIWIGTMILLYFTHVLLFLTGSFLVNVSRPKLNQDYIIIHGAYIHDGKVTPLLAGRVDRAIKFYYKQKEKTKPPILIMSGGQGVDEARSEAEAMAEYARSKGIPTEDIIIEDQSNTTQENLNNSKRIMDERQHGERYNAIYVTSNYHVFRTGVYVRRTGMRLYGLGSKTALYYMPIAMIREYIAYVMMYRRIHIIFGGLSLFLSLGVMIYLYLHSFS